MAGRIVLKDPNAVLDYSLDWATWLGADTISTSVWTVPTGLTRDSQSNTTTVAQVWLSGGTVGQLYAVNNRIVTAAGRTADRTLFVRVTEQ